MSVPWWSDLASKRRKAWSQSGEEGIIETIFAAIGETNRFVVDIGAGDGWNLSNVRFLIERGWSALLVDGKEPPSDGVVQVMVTAENVNQIMDDHGVPSEPDFLSLDLDGADWWIWRALRRQPRALMVEINGAIERGRSITVPYDPGFRHDGTDYYGASFAAFIKLGAEKGYAPVCQTDAQNLFFVRRDMMPPGSGTPIVEYTPMQYHPPSVRSLPWIEV